MQPNYASMHFGIDGVFKHWKIYIRLRFKALKCINNNWHFALSLYACDMQCIHAYHFQYGSQDAMPLVSLWLVDVHSMYFYGYKRWINGGCWRVKTCYQKYKPAVRDRFCLRPRILLILMAYVIFQLGFGDHCSHNLRVMLTSRRKHFCFTYLGKTSVDVHV